MSAYLHRRLRQLRFSAKGQEVVLSLLVTASAVREEMEALCGHYGITEAQYNVLRILRGVHPEGHPRSEILARMVNRASDVTRILNRLEHSGFVQRGGSSVDRRQSIASITRPGLKLLEKMDRPVEDLVSRMTAGLTPDSCVQLHRLLECLYERTRDSLNSHR